MTFRLSRVVGIVLLAISMFALPIPAGAQRPDTAADRYFVGFRGSMSGSDVAMLRSQGAGIGKSFPEVNAIEIILRNQAQIAAVSRNPRVEYVEAVPMRYALDLAGAQLTPTAANGLYGLIATRATEVHSRGVSGAIVRIGVADTGIDYNHPDIAARYRGGIDTVGTGDADPFWNNDVNETHGTHVAGTIIASNDSGGVYGVAYDADLYHARVLGPNGGSSADIMEGVRWLVETANCRIVNLSLGGRSSSRTEENFYKQMRSRGALVVAATGNDAARKLSYPAGYAVNIAVGAIDRNEALADFSNTGRGIDVVAPGVNVISSVPFNTGSEAAVTAATTEQAYGLEYAGKTAGAIGALVNCGLGTAGECPAAVNGNIALIQRGSISFADKVTNAMNAGAIAAIIYNNTAGEFTGTLGAETTADGRAWIPAVSVSDSQGAQLLTQLGNSATVVNKISSWDHYSGTSMATPHVSGVLALIWSANPSLSNSTVENYLITTTKDLGAAGYDTTFGYGLVNASGAVAKAGR